ncbi:hypothetical protein [Mannheimia indoligenes]|uniref:hypothetical protein n=1 Tax=Mannheimia indoligenes TaxID=3103145 RepID=UPI002FE5D74A
MISYSYESEQDFLVYCINEFLDSFRGQDKFFLPLSDDLRLYNTSYANVALLSKKQNIQYRLSIYLNNLVIDTDIFEPKLIRKMPNSFWSYFIELNKVGKLRFETWGANEKIQSDLNEKSSENAIFELIKEIVLMDEYDNFCNDFGKLEISFDLSKESEGLIDKVVKAITLLHKINYQLYRKNYLKNRK